jgi:hypothetical protein
LHVKETDDKPGGVSLYKDAVAWHCLEENFIMQFKYLKGSRGFVDHEKYSKGKSEDFSMGVRMKNKCRF